MSLDKTVGALIVDVVRLMERISKLEQLLAKQDEDVHQLKLHAVRQDAKEALEDAKNDDPVCPKCAGKKDTPQCDWPGHTLTLHRWEEEYN